MDRILPRTPAGLRLNGVNRRHVQYPFSALVGQDSLKLALLLNAVYPGVGGVLVRGEKGTAKSTAARASRRCCRRYK